MTTPTPPNWDTVYAADDAPPPWDIGRPQQAFERLAGRGLLSGRLLDAGCGTGEHALLAAAHGADATGVDISPRAIARARAKATDRSLQARFEVADVLELERLGMTFDTVIDSGVGVSNLAGYGPACQRPYRRRRSAASVEPLGLRRLAVFRVPSFQRVHHAVPVVVLRRVALPVHGHLPQARSRRPRCGDPEFTVSALEAVKPLGQRRAAGLGCHGFAWLHAIPARRMNSPSRRAYRSASSGVG